MSESANTDTTEPATRAIAGRGTAELRGARPLAQFAVRVRERALTDRDYFVQVVLAVDPVPADAVVDELWGFARGELSGLESDEALRLARGEIFMWLFSAELRSELN